MEIFREEFKYNDYDIIGFDLDNTLARYRIKNMARLEYKIMAKYLVEKKKYPSRYLYRPFEDGTDFLIKGLFLDLEKGNLLKLDADAKIIKCFHGIHPLNQTQIEKLYEPNGHWRLTDMYVKDPLCCWNGPLTSLVRALMDYFDISVSLIFARLITTIEEVNAEDGYPTYMKRQMWGDICDALSYMFSYENFDLNEGDFFPNIKKSPELYYYRCSEKVMNWLRELRKQNKLMVLISGSNYDFMNHTAQHTMGDGWKSLFDLIVCFAKKPGFFSGEQRPFVRRDFNCHMIYDPNELPTSQLHKGGLYGKGNWETLLEFARRETGIAVPRALYIGDHIVQDVLTPNKYAGIDIIAVVEELAGENHPDKELIMSKAWGPYMGAGVPGELPSLWATWLQKYACLAVPNMETLAQFSVNHVFVREKIANEQNDNAH